MEIALTTVGCVCICRQTLLHAENKNSFPIAEKSYVHAKIAFFVFSAKTSHDVAAVVVVDRSAHPAVARIFRKVVVKPAATQEVHVTANVGDRTPKRLEQKRTKRALCVLV